MINTRNRVTKIFANIADKATTSIAKQLPMYKKAMEDRETAASGFRQAREERVEAVKKAVEKVTPIKTRNMRTTQYVKTGNPMANGDMPYEGAVASSDRNIPLGSVVKIDGKKYVVADRTAKKIHEQNGDTLDIYTESPRENALKYGVQQKNVEFTGEVLPNRGRKSK